MSGALYNYSQKTSLTNSYICKNAYIGSHVIFVFLQIFKIKTVHGTVDHGFGFINMSIPMFVIQI